MHTFVLTMAVIFLLVTPFLLLFVPKMMIEITLAMMIGIAVILFAIAACIKRLDLLAGIGTHAVNATVISWDLDDEATTVTFRTSKGESETIRYKGDETERFPVGARGKLCYKNGTAAFFVVYHMPK